MATKAFKSEKIDAIKAKAEKAQVAILTEYKGYTVEEITNLRRSLQKDGGDIELVDIEDNKVYVKLQGRCSSCKNSVLTLKSFVETTLQDKVSQDIEVIQV